MSGYEILSIDELDRYPSNNGSQVLRPLRRRLGFRPFGINVWVGEETGDHVIEPHREADGPEELYVVLRGTARFTLREETFDAPSGTLVHVPPDTFREATAAEHGTTVLAMGAKAGETFEPSEWEDFYIAYALQRAGKAAEGRAVMHEALARKPDAWQGSFNAACFEALAGDAEAALAHLRRAIDLNAPEARRYAETDSDLDSLRDDPRFAELLQ
jgi:quercetin dioxygenase-like cupin family protein